LLTGIFIFICAILHPIRLLSGNINGARCAPYEDFMDRLSVTIQREAQHPSPAGEGRVRGNQKRTFSCLFLLTPTLSIRRGGAFSAIYGFFRYAE